VNHESRDLLGQVAQLADDLGPALAPAGHDELLASITTAAMQIFEAGACSIALLDGEELVFHVASGSGDESVKGMHMPASRGIAGWVVHSGQPIAIENVESDPRFAADVARRTGYVPRSILAMPLETDRDIIGVISVLDRRSSGAGGGARDMELLGLFARQAALAIENSRAFNELGRALFRALALASGDGGLGGALEQIAGETGGPNAEMARLAACFHEIALAGPEERAAAVGLLTELLGYVRRRSNGT
jgi:GAF domain-containing protein